MEKLCGRLPFYLLFTITKRMLFIQNGMEQLYSVNRQE